VSEVSPGAWSAKAVGPDFARRAASLPRGDGAKEGAMLQNGKLLLRAAMAACAALAVAVGAFVLEIG